MRYAEEGETPFEKGLFPFPPHPYPLSENLYFPGTDYEYSQPPRARAE